MFNSETVIYLSVIFTDSTISTHGHLKQYEQQSQSLRGSALAYTVPSW